MSSLACVLSRQSRCFPGSQLCMWLCAWRPLVSSERGTECAPACPGSLSAAGALPAREQADSWQWAALGCGPCDAPHPGSCSLALNCCFRVCSPLHSFLRSSSGGPQPSIRNCVATDLGTRSGQFAVTRVVSLLLPQLPSGCFCADTFGSYLCSGDVCDCWGRVTDCRAQALRRTTAC